VHARRSREVRIEFLRQLRRGCDRDPRSRANAFDAQDLTLALSAQLERDEIVASRNEWDGTLPAKAATSATTLAGETGQPDEILHEARIHHLDITACFPLQLAGSSFGGRRARRITLRRDRCCTAARQRPLAGSLGESPPLLRLRAAAEEGTNLTAREASAQALEDLSLHACRDERIDNDVHATGL
jgi:hypothetical protein